MKKILICRRVRRLRHQSHECRYASSGRFPSLAARFRSGAEHHTILKVSDGAGLASGRPAPKEVGGDPDKVRIDAAATGTERSTAQDAWRASDSKNSAECADHRTNSDEGLSYREAGFR